MDLEYQSLRTFADSWGLLYMFLIFCFVIVWTFRPGSVKLSQEAAHIPLNEDDQDE